MGETSWTARKLSPGMEDDFHRLHDPAHGHGWCRCTAWWVETWEEFASPQRAEADNRALRDRLFAAGEHDGYLLYADGQPVAWCQCGRRDRLAKLVSQYGLDPDPAIFAFTCFFVAPAFRGRGCATRLLAFALDDLANRGVRTVQAFPCRHGADASEGDHWCGPESLYVRAGFRLARDHARFPVLERTLVPRGQE